MLRIIFLVAILLSSFCVAQQGLIYKMEPLTMRDCLLQAIKYNLDLEIESYNPKIKQFDLQYAESAFDPAVSSTFAISEVDNESIASKLDNSGNIFYSPSIAKTRAINWEVGIAKKHTLGGSVGLYYGLDITRSYASDRGIRNPRWGHEIYLRASQSLLRNLGVDVNTSEINIAKNEITRTQYTLENKIISVLADVQTAYWNLVDAIASYELQRKSLEQAENLYKITLARIKAGSLAAADILDAERNVAAKQDSLVLSERAIYDAEDKLKQLIRPLDVNYYKNVRILPTEKRIYREFMLDFDQNIKEAQTLRADLKATEISLKNIKINIAKYKNLLLPKADLSGEIGFRGQGRTSSEAWDGMKDGDQFSWTLQLSLEIPLGNRAAQSRYQQSLVQEQQLVSQYKNLQNAVLLEVRNATRLVETTMKRVQTARKTRELAEKQLANEENKFRAGIIALFQVQDTEQKLSEARISESNALSSYLLALVQLEKAKGSLLKNLAQYNIEMPLLKNMERNY